MNADGTRGACPEAYGYLLGTSAVCALAEMALSFLPVRILKRVFPPIITGPVVFLIGSSLIGDSGFANWGGGSGSCLESSTVLCQVGSHEALWGSAEFLGLGFLSFSELLKNRMSGMLEDKTNQVERGKRGSSFDLSFSSKSTALGIRQSFTGLRIGFAHAFFSPTPSFPLSLLLSYYRHRRDLWLTFYAKRIHHHRSSLPSSRSWSSELHLFCQHRLSSSRDFPLGSHFPTESVWPCSSSAPCSLPLSSRRSCG